MPWKGHRECLWVWVWVWVSVQVLIAYHSPQWHISQKYYLVCPVKTEETSTGSICFPSHGWPKRLASKSNYVTCTSSLKAAQTRNPVSRIRNLELCLLNKLILSAYIIHTYLYASMYKYMCTKYIWYIHMIYIYVCVCIPYMIYMIYMIYMHI